MSNKPMASHGLVSYRCKTPFGWCMIGAKNHEDAMNEAKRSTQNPKKEDLQVWNGYEYVHAYPIRCNRCNSIVEKSEVKGYVYQCFECDEDLFQIETYDINKL